MDTDPRSAEDSELSVNAAATLLLALASPPPMDFRETWACADWTRTDGLSVHVMRILDKEGRQLRASVQWSTLDSRADRLHLWGIVDVEGPADPPAFRDIDVSSIANQNNPEAPSWSLRLSRSGAAERGRLFSFSEAPIGVTLRWRQVKNHLSASQAAVLTLTDRAGAVLATREISAAWLSMLEERLRTAMQRTRAEARTPAASCDRVTEHMRL